MCPIEGRKPMEKKFRKYADLCAELGVNMLKMGTLMEEVKEEGARIGFGWVIEEKMIKFMQAGSETARAIKDTIETMATPEQVERAEQEAKECADEWMKKKKRGGNTDGWA